VAQTLLNLAAERSVVDADGLLISLRLTQADLANMAGLARETVNIVLGHLRARGLVEMTRSHIQLRQPVGLLGSVQAMRSPIRLELRHDHDIHVRSFGGRASSGADTRSVDRDARTRLRAAPAAQL
jgi:hypothetical protein